MTNQQIAGLGSMGAPWDLTKAAPCSYACEGEVVAVWTGSRAVAGLVVCAAGHHARVRLRDGREMWRNVSDLARVKGLTDEQAAEIRAAIGGEP